MQNYNTKIIKEIIKQSPEDKNPVDFLTRMFSMSKETAYRRIRNQIPFSIEEVIAVAKHFNLSIDELLEVKSGGNYLLNKDFNIEQKPVDIYSDLLRDDVKFMEKLLVSKTVKITATVNRIPFRLLPYKSLFKLEYCHYMYSTGKIPLITTRYSDIEIPPIINDLHDKATACFSRLNNITCIVDSMLYSNIIKKIQYYRQLQFFSVEDLQLLQAELFVLLEMYENLLRNGKSRSGSDFVFYYSLFNLESNLVSFEYDGESLLQFWIYPESPVVVKNNQLMGDMQKRWIDSKIRNSILITKTTDVHQIEMLRNVYQQVVELTKG